MVQTQRKIGVFGGTFDPPHMAHLVIAAAAIHQLELDEVLVTVAGVPWQKVGSRRITDGWTRLRMAEVAFASVAKTTVSDIELTRRGNSYTIDTLEALAADDVELFLLLGSDAAAGLDTWERPADVAALATIAVVPRRGHTDREVPPGFRSVDLELPGLEVSSTDIRRRVEAGEPIDGLVLPEIAAIVRDERLYVDPDDR